jgi:hypothetical protein
MTPYFRYYYINRGQAKMLTLDRGLPPYNEILQKNLMV